jgi:hypothetical protein
MDTVYVDESWRAGPDGFHYVIGAVAAEDVAEAREGLRGLLPRHRDHLHWHGVTPQIRRELVSAVRSLGIHSFAVTCGPATSNHQQERSRQKCLTRLVGGASAEGVEHGVFESRGPRLDGRDRSTLLGAQQGRPGGALRPLRTPS